MLAPWGEAIALWGKFLPKKLKALSSNLPRHRNPARQDVIAISAPVGGIAATWSPPASDNLAKVVSSIQILWETVFQTNQRKDQ